MKWSHLPMPGSIYDQDADLMDKFRYMFGARNRKMAEDQKAQEAKMKANTPKSGGGAIKRPRRR